MRIPIHVKSAVPNPTGATTVPRIQIPVTHSAMQMDMKKALLTDTFVVFIAAYCKPKMPTDVPKRRRFADPTDSADCSRNRKRAKTHVQVTRANNTIIRIRSRVCGSSSLYADAGPISRRENVTNIVNGTPITLSSIGAIFECGFCSHFFAWNLGSKIFAGWRFAIFFGPFIDRYQWFAEARCIKPCFVFGRRNNEWGYQHLCLVPPCGDALC